MQQSSATQSLHLSFWGLRKIVAWSHSSSQCLLVSAVFGTVSSLHPISYTCIYNSEVITMSEGIAMPHIVIKIIGTEMTYWFTEELII